MLLFPAENSKNNLSILHPYLTANICIKPIQNTFNSSAVSAVFSDVKYCPIATLKLDAPPPATTG